MYPGTGCFWQFFSRNHRIDADRGLVQGSRDEIDMAMVKKMIKDKKESSAAVSCRRNFLSRMWIVLGLVALAQCLLGALAFLISGKKSGAEKSREELIAAGSVDDFAPGTVTLIRQGNLYLCRLDDGGFLAISRKCTHLGCAVPWIAERKQFECPCHASIFDITGNVVKAPAPRALDLYAIRFERDMLMIDIGRVTRRSAFAAEQLVYAEELS